jgi:hypothetical protein
MFKLLAALLASYIVYGLATGVIYAKSGMWGRSYQRDGDPRAYWSVIVVYCLLAVALAWGF